MKAHQRTTHVLTWGRVVPLWMVEGIKVIDQTQAEHTAQLSNSRQLADTLQQSKG